MSVSTWMVVEDEPDIYDVLLAMFEIWGIEGIAFVDGAEAVAWIEDVDKGNVTSEELPELAILDIRLPEVSGPEVGARLRQSKRLGHVAIVLITAYRLSPEEEELVKARAQADALMYKPLPQMLELRKTLDHIIGGRRARAAKAAETGQPAPIINAPTIPASTSASVPVAPISPPPLPVLPARPASARNDLKPSEPKPPESKLPEPKHPEPKQADPKHSDAKPQEKRTNIERTDLGGGRHAKS